MLNDYAAGTHIPERENMSFVSLLVLTSRASRCLARRVIRHWQTTTLFIIMASIIPSCSGTSDPEPEVLRLAGTYATAVSLTQNSCGSGITVQPLPTVVTHTPGGTAVSLQHGPLTHTGTVSAAGAFTTQANVVADPATGTSTLTIAGQFSLTGFVADVMVNVARNVGGACSYTVRWVGTKQGAPNTIP
ncbi:MAG TPA: hypothetical protein VM939_11035 [Gemmatimonadaceae bacterium]|nr:hypothetical protein [Gemmatimonadaceae bacterium]